MSLLSSSIKRQKLLFMAAAIAAGGYASYCICTSPVFEHRRKRLLRVLSTLSFFCEAASQSAESMCIISSDLKSFLLSDDDTVPRSLQQALKLTHTEEFQESLTVLSAALVRGLRRGMDTKARKEVYGQSAKPCFQEWKRNDLEVGNEDVACREIHEVSFTAKRQEDPRLPGQKKSISFPDVEKGGLEHQEWDRKSYSSGSAMHVQRSKRIGVVFDNSRRAKTSEGVVEKVLTKLFSQAGVDFACSVTGSFARNLILAFFDRTSEESFPSRHPGSCLSSNCLDRPSQTAEGSLSNYAQNIDVLHTHKCRMLIAECMQTFIDKAMTVYIDKTKDVNIYNDMVAGIVNPLHKDSVKDLLTSICSNAIETLVRTSYAVYRGRQAEATKGYQQVGNSQRDTEECSTILDRNRPLPSSTDMNKEEGHDPIREGLMLYEQSDYQASSYSEMIGTSQGTNTAGVRNLIDGVSKTLAIPSNRKLIVDVAGTMSSEAVRSFVNVVVSTASSHVSNIMHRSWDTVRDCFSDHRDLKLQQVTRDMAAKTYILASICLAMCLHMIAGSQVLQT